MISRREWLTHTSQVAALQFVPSGLLWAAQSSPALAQDSVREVIVELTGMREGVEQAVEHCLGSLCSPTQLDKLAVRPEHESMPWERNSLRVHTRYVPEPAIDLSKATGLPLLSSSREIRHVEGEADARTAIALGIEPFAVLVNRVKAQAAGVEKATLDTFDRQSLKPRFLLRDGDGVGDNGWVFPLLAKTLHMQPHQPLGDLFLSDTAQRGLARLHSDILRRLDVRSDSPTGDDSHYAELLDPQHNEVVAIYGNPQRLQHIVAATANQNPIDIVPLSEFLGIQLTELPRMQFLQCGTRIEDPDFAVAMMPTLAQALQERTLQHHYSECVGAQCTAGKLDLSTKQYEVLPLLELWTDRAFGVQLMELLVRVGRQESADQAALIAASNAFYTLSAYLRASGQGQAS